MSDLLGRAKSALEKAVREAVGEFGSAVRGLPEITYCDEAASILEEESCLLRDRHREIEREEDDE